MGEPEDLLERFSSHVQVYADQSTVRSHYEYVAKALKEMLNKRGTDVSVMLNLQVEEEELINRLLERGKVSGRSDDNLDTIKSRSDVYHKQTAPLADYYIGEGKHVAIKGMGTIEEVFGRIKDAVNYLLWINE